MGKVRLRDPQEEQEGESEIMKICLGLKYLSILCRFLEGIYIVHVMLSFGIGKNISCLV